MSLGWAVVARLRRRYYPEHRRYRPRLAVVSVGNIHSGGSGKTPLVMEICRHFSALSPVIISRGYRGELSRKGAVVDTSDPHGSARYGDEPWLMARRLAVPVIIGRRRVRSLKLAESSGRHLLAILDDGFQHLSVRRDRDIVVIDAGRSPEESWCLPLGDLREPLSALRAASAVVLTTGTSDDYAAVWRAILAASFPKIPVFEARRRILGLYEGEDRVDAVTAAPFAAFCGIAGPERFRADLATLGPVPWFRAYPDHHRYSARDIDVLVAGRKSVWARTLVTTAKDWDKAREGLREREERLLRLEISYELPKEFWYVLADLREHR